MTSSNQAWETVLAAVQADLDRTEGLLRPDAVDATALMPGHNPAEAGPAGMSPAGVGRTDGGTPPGWAYPEMRELPPLETMPPVPAELGSVITAMQAQILGLQIELTNELRNWHDSQTVAGSPAQKATSPLIDRASFVDRRL